jgi:imidazolonepropionase-like amidohydrolase
LDVAAAQVNRDRWAREGVGLLREAGGDPSVVLALTPEPGRPYVVPATRHLAPAGWYFPAVHLPAESDEVVEVALADVDAGARWVKLVADFAPARAGAVGARAAAARSTGAPAAPEPTYDLDVVRRLVSAAHAVGARVAAHVTTPLSADLVAIGIDSVEHGTAVEEDTVRAMARRGTAWTPTLCAVLSCPPGDAGRRRLVEQRRERFSVLLPFAVGLGVPVLTGSDVVGSVPREVELLVSCGVKPLDALRCATTTATRFLGTDAARASATVVTYDADPREHPDVLGRPAAVVVGGRRVC